MNKFLIILQKELKELLTIQTLVPILLISVIFYILGNVMDGIMKPDMINISEILPEDTVTEIDGQNIDIIEQTVNKDMIIGLINNDKTEMSQNVINQMKLYGITVIEPNSTDPQEAFEELKNYELLNGESINIKVLAVFEQGFGEKLESKNQGSAEIKLYSYVDSFGIMSMMSSSSVSGLIESLNQAISSQMLNDITSNQNIDLNFIRSPIVTSNYTVLNDNVENISSSEIQGYITSQTTFIPVIIFMVLIYSTQSLASSIANEKGDKTLETLMTTPVSRITVLFAKMLAAAITAAIFTLAFMFSYRNFMNSMNGSVGESSDSFTQILENFGISFSVSTFLIIGIQLFLSVLCGLAIALIIGVLAEDVKNLQSMIMPVMLVVMVPYFLSMFMDINTLPAVIKYIIYAIPFTHTFIATSSIFTQNYPVLIGGMIYQAVFVSVMMFLAVKIFNSDKLFTLGMILKPKLKNR